MTGKRVLGIVFAGRQGKRLMPLTEDRAKAAVPFGGLYLTVGRYHARLPEIRNPRAPEGRLCGVLPGRAAYWASGDLDERYEQAMAVQLAQRGGAQVNAALLSFLDEVLDSKWLVLGHRPGHRGGVNGGSTVRQVHGPTS
jgi:hypothetical protein